MLFSKSGNSRSASGGQVRSPLWLGLYGALFFYVTLHFLTQYPIPELHSKIRACLSAFFLVLGFAGIGFAFSQLIARIFHSGEKIERSRLSFVAYGAFGLGIIGLSVLCAGAFLPGTLRTKLMILSFLMAAAGINYGIFLSKSFLSKDKRTQRTFSAFESICLVIGFMGVVFSLLACFSPITYYDSLVYHLALPAYYNQVGSIGLVPFNLYSCFPANTEMIFLYVLNQLPEPEYTINLLCWLASLGIGWELYQWAKELGHRRHGFLAFALWWTMPAVVMLSFGAYIDIFLALYVMIAVRLFFTWKDQKGASLYLFLSGFSCGLAFSTKYTGAICPMVLSVFFLYLAGQGIKSKQILRWLVTFGGAALIPAIFWLFKNAWFVGNPVFPFFYNLLGGNVDWAADTAHGYFSMLTEYDSQSPLLEDILLAPWKITNEPTKYGGGADVLGDFGWPLFILTLPLGLIFWKQNRRAAPLNLFFWAHFIIWVISKPVLRFLIPALPIAVFVTGGLLNWLLSMDSKQVKFFSIALILPLLVSNLFIASLLASQFQSLHVSLGLETRTEFLSRRLNFYPTFERINASLNSHHKVLVVGEQRTFHLSVPYVGSNFFAPAMIAQLSNKASSVDSLFQDLRKENITHILVSEKEIGRMGGLKYFGFSSDGEIIFNSLLKERSFFISEDRGVRFYALADMGQL